jgi:hypothetical protein
MDACFQCRVLCVVSVTGLSLAREVLLSGVCLSMIVKPRNEQNLAYWGCCATEKN